VSGDGVPEVIDDPDRLRLLLHVVCPSFQHSEIWREWRARQRGATAPADQSLAIAFVRHLTTLEAHGERAEFPAVFELLERVCREGHPAVLDLVVVGYLEELQNPALHAAGSTPDAFVSWLGPESRLWWSRLLRFWEGDTAALAPLHQV
jgi:hypothetical protein